MSIKTILESQLLEAMKNKNETEKTAIRTTLSSIKLAEVEKGQPLDDLAIIGILQKEIKIRKEAINDAKNNQREDLVQIAEDELSVLERLLPDQLSEAELRAMIKEVITQLNANSITDTGKVMKTLVQKVAGRAPNDVISQIVKDILSGSP